MWKKGEIYIPSWQSISIIAMWLAHQLTLLGIYKRAELNLPFNKKEPLNEKKDNT